MQKISKDTLEGLLRDFLGIELDVLELTILEKQLNDLLNELKGVWDTELNDIPPLFSGEDDKRYE